MILCEWDAPEGDPGQSCVHLYARILSSSLTSVSIFSVSCYSIVSISMLWSLIPEISSTAKAGVLEKLSLACFAKLSGLTPGVSYCSVESAVS